MPLVVHTAQYRYGGPDRVDITRGGRDGTYRDLFAPTWPLLNWGRKQMKLADTVERKEWVWLAYRARYEEQMRESYKRRKRAWQAFLAERARAVLVCFCANPDQCHRRALAELLAKLGATDAGELAVTAPPNPTLPGVEP
jgi:hypothetical protein